MVLSCFRHFDGACKVLVLRRCVFFKLMFWWEFIFSTSNNMSWYNFTLGREDLKRLKKSDNFLLGPQKVCDELLQVFPLDIRCLFFTYWRRLSLFYVTLKRESIIQASKLLFIDTFTVAIWKGSIQFKKRNIPQKEFSELDYDLRCGTDKLRQFILLTVSLRDNEVIAGGLLFTS